VTTKEIANAASAGTRARNERETLAAFWPLRLSVLRTLRWAKAPALPVYRLYNLQIKSSRS
jgi:hypothetical protein